MKRGRPPFANLNRIGYESAARLISDRIWDRNARCTCWVLPDGGIVVRETSSAAAPPPDDCIVGVYEKTTRRELIEDDLIARLRELSTQAIAA